VFEVEPPAAIEHDRSRGDIINVELEDDLAVWPRLRVSDRVRDELRDHQHELVALGRPQPVPDGVACHRTGHWDRVSVVGQSVLGHVWDIAHLPHVACGFWRGFSREPTADSSVTFSAEPTERIIHAWAGGDMAGVHRNVTRRSSGIRAFESYLG
jgi:hypothetical protein